jgi:hypothetical protein
MFQNHALMETTSGIFATGKENNQLGLDAGS